MGGLNLMGAKKYDLAAESVNAAIETRMAEEPWGGVLVMIMALVLANFVNFLLYLKNGVTPLQWVILGVWCLSVMFVLKAIYTLALENTDVVVNKGVYALATQAASILVQAIIAVLVLSVPFITALWIEAVTAVVCIVAIALGMVAVTSEMALCLIAEAEE